MKQKVVVIVGPTAVGKTKLGVELAKALNGEVISGDSMQIYKHMDIGTAKVTKEEMDGVVHHLIDIREIDEGYSVSDFQKMVREKINEIEERGHLPIIVGGTGLYIKAALYDYTFQEEKKEENHQFDSFTNEELYAHLASIDPDSAKELHPNNRRRVARAIEIASSGKTKSEMISTQEHIPLYDIYMIGLTLDRAKLYERINLRVDLMYDHGLVEEFNSLLKLGAKQEYQSMKAIGYREFFEEGDTKEMIKQHSRNYAKRQYTWFKNQFDVHWINTNLEDFLQTVNQAIDYVENGASYRYIALAYSKVPEIKGIMEVKEGYSCNNNQNPSKYDIHNNLNGVIHLNRIYYNENEISLKKLMEVCKVSEGYAKPSWLQQDFSIKMINKFYEM